MNKTRRFQIFHNFLRIRVLHFPLSPYEKSKQRFRGLLQEITRGCLLSRINARRKIRTCRGRTAILAETNAVIAVFVPFASVSLTLSLSPPPSPLRPAVVHPLVRFLGLFSHCIFAFFVSSAFFSPFLHCPKRVAGRVRFMARYYMPRFVLPCRFVGEQFG